MSCNIENIKCNLGKGGIAKVTLIAYSDLKRLNDGSFSLKRKYGKFKRPVVTIDYREPEIIGLA